MRFSLADAERIGEQLGISWEKVDIHEFLMGLDVELEHGNKYGDQTNVTNNDPVTTGRIAYAHLLEIPDYYTRLQKMENEAEGHS